MKQHNPVHPGEFIFRTYVQPLQLSNEELAHKLDVPLESLNQLLNAKLSLNEEWADRLSKTLGRSTESWLLMQKNYDSFNSS
ncbi:MAG: addiction module antidote protein, HigA family [Gammaproteobacteria bacterium]|nr:MAG: addiction module antidote protein, HigA family [Gammaproteobacteria bacterium]